MKRATSARRAQFSPHPPRNPLRLEVPPEYVPGDENFDTANARLNDGLKSCRAVLSNYRALLVGDGEGQRGETGFTETIELRQWRDD